MTILFCPLQPHRHPWGAFQLLFASLCNHHRHSTRWLNFRMIHGQFIWIWKWLDRANLLAFLLWKKLISKRQQSIVKTFSQTFRTIKEHTHTHCKQTWSYQTVAIHVEEQWSLIIIIISMLSLSVLPFHLLNVIKSCKWTSSVENFVCERVYIYKMYTLIITLDNIAQLYGENQIFAIVLKIFEAKLNHHTHLCM